MCPRRRMEIGQEYLTAQRTKLLSSHLLMNGVYQPPSVINPEEREFRERLRSKHAHVEQERPELCRVGKRQSLSRSADGCDSHRRSANLRRSDSVRQRIGFVRDSCASRTYTGRSLTRKTMRRSRIFLPLDQ